MSDVLMRAVLLAGGLACVACEVWGTFDFMWEKHGRWNYLVVGSLVLTSLSAILPMAAEHAHRQGMRALKWSAWLGVPVALAFVFTVSVQRTGTVADADDTTRKQVAVSIALAKVEAKEAEDQLQIDKAAVRRNCDVWRSICDKAKADQRATEKKLADARAVLKKQGVEVDDSMARRIVTYLPFLTREQVLLYQPMLLPIGLAVIGSVLIAIGARSGRRIIGVPDKIEKPPASTPAKELIAEPDELDPQPVVDFLKRRLRVARGARAEWGSIYIGFLTDWQARGMEGEPLTAAQFGHVLRYICDKANISVERKGSRVVCIDRKLIAAAPTLLMATREEGA